MDASGAAAAAGRTGRPHAPHRAGGPGLSPGEFAALFAEHGRLLWCVAAAALSGRAGAEDVVQQSAVVALERLGDFDPGTSFAAWMTRIVRNVAMNEARKTHRRRTGSMDGDLLDRRTGPTPAHGAARPVTSGGDLARDQESFDDRLVEALGELDETARQCVLLRTVMDRSYAEIARTLDIPEGTAASHVHRARRALRARLMRQDGNADATRSGQ